MAVFVPIRAFFIERTCPRCQGRGEIIDDPCRQCGGAGRTKKERTLSVNIPAGVEDGTRIRLSGEGEGGLRGGPSGDLYIFLTITPHSHFRRNGADLFCVVPISFTLAALGGHITVPTIAGGVNEVTVPEGTQTGRQIRLRGMGMPILRSREKGDFYVQVVVATPQKLTVRQRELFRELEADDGADNAADQAGFFEKMKSFISGNDD